MQDIQKAALVSGDYGEGGVWYAGFLPGLPYIRSTQQTRNSYISMIDEHEEVYEQEVGDTEVDEDDAKMGPVANESPETAVPENIASRSYTSYF